MRTMMTMIYPNLLKTMTQHHNISMTTPTGSHPSHGKNAGTQSSAKSMAGLSPEESKRRQLFYQKMAYIEMKKLRPKHPHA